MELEWEPDFETGNEYIDLQHRNFVDLITSYLKKNETVLKHNQVEAYQGNYLHGIRIAQQAA